MYDLIKELKSFKPYDDRERKEVEETSEFLKTSDNCYDRSNLRGHVTAGAFVCDRNGNILLNHHRKCNAWIEFGGHCDGETDCLNVAKREVFEETGITKFYTNKKIFDVGVFDIEQRGNEPEHKHYGVHFLFITDDKNFQISNESVDIKWVTIDEAKSLVKKDDIPINRMIDKYEELYKKIIINYDNLQSYQLELASSTT